MARRERRPDDHVCDDRHGLVQQGSTTRDQNPYHGLSRVNMGSGGREVFGEFQEFSRRPLDPS
jgi:hypothetical protein